MGKHTAGIRAAVVTEARRDAAQCEPPAPAAGGGAAPPAPAEEAPALLEAIAAKAEAIFGCDDPPEVKLARAARGGLVESTYASLLNGARPPARRRPPRAR